MESEQLLYFSKDIHALSPAVFAQVLLDAFQTPDLETDLTAFETEFQVMKELRKTFSPNWMTLSDVNEKNKALSDQIEELIKHVGIFRGAIMKLEKISAKLKHQLETQEAKLDRLIVFLFHTSMLSFNWFNSFAFICNLHNI